MREPATRARADVPRLGVVLPRRSRSVRAREGARHTCGAVSGPAAARNGAEARHPPSASQVTIPTTLPSKGYPAVPSAANGPAIDQTSATTAAIASATRLRAPAAPSDRVDEAVDHEEPRGVPHPRRSRDCVPTRRGTALQPEVVVSRAQQFTHGHVEARCLPCVVRDRDADTRCDPDEPRRASSTPERQRREHETGEREKTGRLREDRRCGAECSERDRGRSPEALRTGRLPFAAEAAATGTSVIPAAANDARTEEVRSTPTASGGKTSRTARSDESCRASCQTAATRMAANPAESSRPIHSPSVT